MAVPSCLRLFWQVARLAASRTFWTAGTKRAMRMAMMAITTKSSMRVKARRREWTTASCSISSMGQERDITGRETHLTIAIERTHSKSARAQLPRQFPRRDEPQPVDFARAAIGLAHLAEAGHAARQ